MVAGLADGAQHEPALKRSGSFPGHPTLLCLDIQRLTSLLRQVLISGPLLRRLGAGRRAERKHARAEEHDGSPALGWIRIWQAQHRSPPAAASRLDAYLHRLSAHRPTSIAGNVAQQALVVKAKGSEALFLSNPGRHFWRSLQTGFRPAPE